MLRARNLTACACCDDRGLTVFASACVRSGTAFAVIEGADVRWTPPLKSS